MDDQQTERRLRKTNAAFIFFVGLALSYLGGHIPKVGSRFQVPGEVIGVAMYLSAALWLSLMVIGIYRFVRRQPGKVLHWVWWVAPSILLLLGIGLLVLNSNAPVDSKPSPPSPEDLARKMENQATLAEQAQLFESPLGFRIHVPQGYRYLSSPSEPLAFVAVNPDNTVRFQVVVFQTNAPLDAVFSDILARLRASEHNYSIQKINEPAESGNATASCRFEVERNGTVQTGYLCLKTTGVDLYQYQHYASVDATPDELEQLTVVEQSFEIDPGKS